MKKLNFFIQLFTFFFLFVFAANVMAQTPQHYNFTSGTSSNSFPFNVSSGKETQYLFLAGDFGTPTPATAGNITKIYIYMSGTASGTFTNLVVKLGQSTITSLPASIVTGLTTVDSVYSTTLSSTANSWMSITLQTPFAYNPAQSLIVDIYQCATTASGMTVWNTMLTGARRNYITETSCVPSYVGQDASTLNFGVDITVAPPPPPTLVSPPNNATGLPTTDTLVWNASSGAVSYRVQVATDTGFTNLVVNDSTPTTTSRIVTGLNWGTTYYWHVNAKNTGGSSSYSTRWAFSTLAIPPAPTLVSPPNNATGLPTTDTLVWNASSGASTYRVQVATDTGFTNLVVNDSTPTTTSRIVSGLNWGTTYYWHVNAKNAGGSSSYSTRWAFSTLAVPPAPTLISPANGATGLPLTDTLRWNASTGAVTYRVQLATDSLFANLVVNDSTVTTTSRVVSSLTNLTWYWWRVNGKNAAGTGSWSTVWKFQTIVGAPPAPTLVRPTNGAQLTTLTPELVWNVAANATSYEVQVNSDSTFTAGPQFDTTITIDSIMVPAGKLALGATYYWRARGNNVSGYGPYSVIWHFSTPNGITNNGNIIPKVFKLYNNYPNPFNPETTIKFDLPNSADVKLIVYNVLGQEVTTLVNGHYQAGSYSAIFEGSNYPSGVYFYKITAGIHTDIHKMVLVK